MTVATATSDTFLERPENRVRAQGFQLTLIYSDSPAHAFENLMALAAPDSIIAIHDCRPHAWMLERQRK
jgi:hypothetical protein